MIRSNRRAKKKIYRKYTKRTLRKKRLNIRKNVYHFTRYCDDVNIIADAVNPTRVAIDFRLNKLPNYTEFTALYDMFKINAVKVIIRPQMSQVNSLGTVNNIYYNDRIYSCIDYNDATAPTDINEVRQYQSCKIGSSIKPHKRYIYKPKILDSSSYSMHPWVACTAPNTSWYGLKVAIDTVPNAAFWTVEVKYYLSFKNVR